MEDNHRELALQLKNDSGVGLEVVFRVFDDGFGFRYAYSAPGVDTLRINGERTQFRLPRLLKVLMFGLSGS